MDIYHQIQNLTFLPGLDLTFGRTCCKRHQTLEMTLLSNSMAEIGHKICAANLSTTLNLRDHLWPSLDLKDTYNRLGALRVLFTVHFWAIWAELSSFQFAQEQPEPQVRICNNREQFDFDLTCDVIANPEVNAILFRSTDLQWLSNDVWILKIGPVVSEIGGAQKSPAPPVSCVME